MKRTLFNNWFDAQNYMAYNRKDYGTGDIITIGEKSYKVVGVNIYGDLILKNGKEREVL